MRRTCLSISLLVLTMMLVVLSGINVLADSKKVVEPFNPTVFLKGYEFKSIHDVKIPYGLEKKAYTDDENGNYIVRFTGPVKDEWKANLEKLGVTVRDYIPEFSFLVSMQNAVCAEVAALPFVQEVLIYQPAFKINPALINEHGVLAIKDGKSDGYFLVETFDGNFKEVEMAVINGHGQLLDKGKDLAKVKINRAYLAALANLNSVKYIEEVPAYKLMNDIAKGYVDADDMWTLGYDGAGQIVGIADTGLDTGVNNSTMHLDFQGRIDAIYALGRTNDASDTHGHGTHVAGSVLGSGARSNGQIKGMAPAAHVVFQSVLDSSGGLGGLPTDLNTLFQQSYNLGARIHTNSWGASVYGQYNTDSVQVDQFINNNRNMIVLFAASNDGPSTNSIGSPGTAKNCITVGASENYRPDKDTYSDDPNQIASFSSRGWCTDGRFKPDVVAPGTWILSTKSSVAPVSNYWADYNTYYAYMGGTSMATPITAGTVAVARQYIMANWAHTPTAALMKAVLINGATDLGFGYPSRDQGWGRVSLTNSLVSREVKWVDETDNLSTGQSMVYNYTVESGNTPLKITLCWTDYPGSTSASKALVNDIDLKVTAPDGTVYYGNDFTSPYNTAFDRLNNVENVFVQYPNTGTWTIEVLGYNVPNGPQNYALVAGGDFGVAPNDPNPPAVSITAPVNGAAVSESVLISADATDDLGVARVEFYCDGSYLGSDLTAPYEYTWNSRSVANGGHSLTARAFDGAGNNTMSSAVAITVDNIITTQDITEIFKNYVSNSGTRSQYYYLDVTTAGTVSLNLTWDTTSDLDMFLYDPAGTEVARAYTTAKPENISYTATTLGTYKVKVDAYSGSGTYTLTATHPIDLGLTAHFEQTDSITTRKGYKEYYVTAGTGGTLNVEVNAKTGADLDIYIYNPAGTQVAVGKTTYNPETVCYYPIAAAGTYKVKVQAVGKGDTFTIKINSPK